MARQATHSTPIGARRSPSPSGWADLPKMAPSCRASSKTITSTAKSSGWTARCASRRSNCRLVLAGVELRDDRAEVLGLHGLVLRGQRVINGSQNRALEMQVEHALGALDGLLRQFQDLLGGLDPRVERIADRVVGQAEFDRPLRRDPRAWQRIF